MTMMTMTGMGSSPVCCRDCQSFTQDTKGSGLGIGKCGTYELGATKNPTQMQIRQARVARGNNSDNGIFWGGTLKDRDCSKFQAKKSPDIIEDQQGFSQQPEAL
jgi:hypothetical protein